MKLIVVVLTVILGFGVLFLSISRAGLERTKKENDQDSLRKKEIVVSIINSNNETEEYVYKIPETGMLPDSPFYGFKILRDKIWIQLTRNPAEKAKLVLLLADKKISEADILVKDDKPKMAIEAGSEALDKLKYADRIIESVTNKEQADQLKAQIFSAGPAYKEIIYNIKDAFDIDTEKYGQLLEDIDSWNESQKEKKEQSEFE